MGRPRVFDAPATQAIRIRVTPAQRADLERVALDNKTDMATVIREAVNEYVTDYRESGVFRGTKRRAT
jgi:hypothetical protein